MSSATFSIPAALRRHAPGVLASALVAVGGMALGALPVLAGHGLSALTLAIVLGIALGNLLPGRWHAPLAAGIGFSKHWLLRAGIVLYGVRLTFQDIGAVGPAGVALDGVMVLSTFALACALGVHWLKLERNTAMLIGAGSAICGAAAVMAAAPVVRGRADQVAVAVATVVVFGTLAMFVYPVLYQLNAQWAWIGGGERGFGLYIGATVHEVAQVVAASRQIGEAAVDAAVITKLVRVMLLAPFLPGLAWWLARRKQPASARADAGVAIPWFAFGFIAVVAANSWLQLPSALAAAINTLDAWLLAMAMAALGISTRAGALRQAGIKPLLLALVLFVWLMLGGAGAYLLVEAGFQYTACRAF